MSKTADDEFARSIAGAIRATLRVSCALYFFYLWASATPVTPNLYLWLIAVLVF